MVTEPKWNAAGTINIIDQLFDIAHDEGDPRASGISWYAEYDDVPHEELAELAASGLFTVSTGPRPDEHSVRFSAAGIEFYDPCGTGGR